MTDQTDETLDALRALARTAAAHTHAPYSHRREAAVLLLADGTWAPGVRVESASFSLVIPALLNAFTTATAAGRSDVVAIALDRAFWPEEEALLQRGPLGGLRRVAEDAYVASLEALPTVGARLDPFLDAPPPEDAAAGIALAREVAQRAYVPESQFPVGCVLVTGEGRLIPGVNVEHADWSRILCAERNALSTAVTWGLTDPATLYLTGVKDPTTSPCGACRQLLVELAPEATLWMDRGAASPEAASPAHLLPGAFNGQALVHPARLSS